jgi:hypothetical protein
MCSPSSSTTGCLTTIRWGRLCVQIPVLLFDPVLCCLIQFCSIPDPGSRVKKIQDPHQII